MIDISQQPASDLNARVNPNPVFFNVGSIPIRGDLILSPMDGFSDLPCRLLCRELGSAMSYTEFVNVAQWANQQPNRIARKKLTYDPCERPVTFQIYGHEEDLLVKVAIRLQDLRPDIIDINMGCYVKDIAERGAGSGMLRHPDKIARVFARLSSELAVPVTGKIRLGWDERERNHVQVARIMEDNGAKLVAVHGRTRAQAFKGPADWDAIAEVKAAVRIPVIGNGDVRTVADIDRIKAHTGCDGVMIGRAAIGNPWIFSRRDRDEVPLADRIALMRRHLGLNLDFYGPELGLILFRKHAARYIQGIPGAAVLRVPLLTSTSVDQFDQLVGELTDRIDGVRAKDPR